MQVDPGYQRAHLEAARRLPLTIIVIVVIFLVVMFGYDYVQRAVNPLATTTTTTAAAD